MVCENFPQILNDPLTLCIAAISSSLASIDDVIGQVYYTVMFFIKDQVLDQTIFGNEEGESEEMFEYPKGTKFRFLFLATSQVAFFAFLSNFLLFVKDLLGLNRGSRRIANSSAISFDI
jgi:hypothetical protein